MNIKKYFIPIIVILVGLVLIFVFIWFARQQNEIQPPELQEITPGLEQTERRMEVFTISAQVREVRAASLLVDVLVTDVTEGLPLMREVLVTPNTVIMRRMLKDLQEYTKEMAEYRSLIAELQAIAEETGVQPQEWPPVPTTFTETAITLNQIETGSRVWIIAGEDIRTAESFTAASIKVEI